MTSAVVKKRQRPHIVPVGERVGRLVATETRAAGDVKALCDCGTPTQIRLSDWGKTQSCGCYRRDLSRSRRTTHGMTGTPTYVTWLSMRNRCDNPRDPSYPDYGGRGITVCERWRDFVNFYADMGERPDGLSIGRIDNDGNYEPGNCRWETWEQQAGNRRPWKSNRARATHCKRGHPLSPGNIYVKPSNGARVCLTCHRAWRNEAKRRRGVHPRLTEAQRSEIREQWAAGGCSQAGLARRFGVSPGTVRNILAEVGQSNAIQTDADMALKAAKWGLT